MMGRNRATLPLCHPTCPGEPWEQLTCLQQFEGEVTRKDRHRCKVRRADRQTSAQPGRAGKSILMRIVRLVRTFFQNCRSGNREALARFRQVHDLPFYL
jgi:hypothetical protein